MRNELLNICEHLVAATVTGVFQGVLLTALAALVLKCVSSTNAATRHALWLTALLLVSVLVPLNYLSQSRPEPQGRVPVTLAPIHPKIEVNPVSEQGRELAPILLGEPVAAAQDDLFVPDDASEGANDFKAEEEKGEQPAASVPPATLETRPLSNWGKATSFVGPWTERLARFAESVSWQPTPGNPTLAYACVVAVAVWLAGALIRFGILAGGLYRVNQLKRTSFAASSPVQGLFEEVCSTMRIQRPISLGCSEVQRGPVLLGFLRPMVLVPHPEVAAWPAVDLEQIFRHELAHVARRDDWANLMQTAVQAALFFHPAVWWINRQISFEREIACDDYVLQKGTSVRGYALVLANLASRLAVPSLAPGISANKTQLQQRINMILNTQRNTSTEVAKTRLGLFSSLAACCAGLALWAGPRMVLAETPAPPAPRALVAANEAPDAEAPGQAGESVSVDVNPGTPAVEPGPKYKPEPLAPQAVVPVIPPRPIQALPPLIVGVQAPDAAPRPPRAPEPPDSDVNFEERLNRLEKMVKALMAEQHNKFPKDAFDWKGFQGSKEKDMKILKDLESADAEKKAKESAETMNRFQHDMARFQMDASKQQLEALRRTRDGLAREVDRLDRQIKRLEEQKQRSSDATPKAGSSKTELNLNVDQAGPHITADTRTLVTPDVDVELSTK